MDAVVEREIVERMRVDWPLGREESFGEGTTQRLKESFRREMSNLPPLAQRLQLQFMYPTGFDELIISTETF